jgi:hypothetical protein
MTRVGELLRYNILYIILIITARSVYYNTYRVLDGANRRFFFDFFRSADETRLAENQHIVVVVATRRNPVYNTIYMIL